MSLQAIGLSHIWSSSVLFQILENIVVVELEHDKSKIVLFLSFYV
jgi:hypothetical protein